MEILTAVEIASLGVIEKFHYDRYLRDLKNAPADAIRRAEREARSIARRTAGIPVVRERDTYLGDAFDDPIPNAMKVEMSIDEYRPPIAPPYENPAAAAVDYHTARTPEPPSTPGDEPKTGIVGSIMSGGIGVIAVIAVIVGVLYSYLRRR